MTLSPAAHPAHGAQGFLLLTLNNVEAILPGSPAPIINQLALECVTLPGNPSSFSPDPELERDVWLVLRIGPNEFVISPTQVIRHNRSERVFAFEASRDGIGSGSKWFLKLPVPRDQTDAEDQETFAVLLAQYAALEADAGGSPPTYSDAVASGNQIKRPVPALPVPLNREIPPLPPRTPPLPPSTAASNSLPPPAQDRKYNDDLRGQLVLVDEHDGQVVGTLGEQFHIREDNAMLTRGREKDPVIVDIPAEDDTRRATEVYVYPIPPDQQDTVLKTASLISRGLIFATDTITAGMGVASSFFVNHSKPNEKPLEFSERTRGSVRRIHNISGKAVEVTAKTTGLIHDALGHAVDHISGNDKPKNKSRATTPTPPAPGTPPRPLPLKNRLFIATDMLLTTAENSAKQLLEQGTLRVSEALGHKYGKDMRDATLLVGHSARNVGLVYIDVRGVGRRALFKKAGARYIKGKLGTKDVVLGVDQNGVVQQGGPSPSASTTSLPHQHNKGAESLPKTKTKWI